MRLLGRGNSKVKSLAFAPDSRKLLAVGHPCRVWDLTCPGSAPREFEADGNFAPTFLTASHLLVWGRWPGDVGPRLRRYDAGAGAVVADLTPAVESFRPITVHPDGTKLAAFGASGRGGGRRYGDIAYRIGDGGLEELEDGVGPRGDAHFVQVGGTYQWLDAPHGRPMGGRGDFGSVLAPGGDRVYVVARRGVRGFDSPAFGPAVVRAGPVCRSPHALAAHPDGRLVATVDGTGAVTMRDAATLKVIRSYDFGVTGLRAVAFSPDGLLCAVGAKAGGVVLFDVDD